VDKKKKKNNNKKEKAFNPNIENNLEIEEQSQNPKTIDVKEYIEYIWSDGSNRPSVTEYRIPTFLTHCKERFLSFRKLKVSRRNFM